MDDRISIRVAFERFPATVKGAFVLRGEDPDPHQVRLERARVAEVAGRGSSPIDLHPVTLEVAPHRDVFVPFEFPLTELGPGWYTLECEVFVDAVPFVARPGKRFPVAWPRATVRRGTVDVGKAVDAGGTKVRIEHVDCGGDSIRVSYTAPAALPLKISADGTALAVLDDEFDEEAGKGRVTAYPLPKTAQRLSFEVKGAASPVEVKLPA